MTTPEHQQAEREELLACPFCGCTDIFIEPDERGSGGQWVGPIHVGCTACKCEQCEDEEIDAIAAWNRRAGERADVVPLSEARLYDLADSEECNPDAGGWGAKFDFLAFARAIEHAHGIGIAASQDSAKGGKP